MVKTFTLEKEVWIPRTPEEIFPFFSEAQNLGVLTPNWISLEILTPDPIKLRVGALIDYRIRVHGIPIRWRTEITEWDPPYRFVDVQRRGPYQLWHHTHSFQPRDGGTLCSDRVWYRPFGGALMNWLFVRRDVQRIFRYREQKIMELFGAPGTASRAVRGGWATSEFGASSVAAVDRLPGRNREDSRAEQR